MDSALTRSRATKARPAPVPPISATGAQWPPVCPGEADDVAVNGEPGELTDPAPACAGLGDVEPADAEPTDPDCAVLGDAELVVGDPEVAGGVTVNCSTAMGALPLAAG